MSHAGAYVESSTLQSVALSSTQRGVSQLLLQNLAGDDGLDLLLIRNTNGTPELAVWERRNLANGETFVLDQSTAGTFVFDAQGLYVPGGVAGASRDLAVLVLRGGDSGTRHSVQFVRNEGPGSRPRFGREIARLDVPNALRLHYFPSFPIPPGQPGYVSYPLIASTGDERMWVVAIADDGSVTRQTAALLHPGGASDVLVFREPNAMKPAFISLGASPALLWLQNGDGSYSSQPLTLPGLEAGDRVVKGVMAQFQQSDGHPDLVLALADGRVLRWDGAGPVGAGMPISFGPAQAVATGLTVHDMVELGVPYRDAMLTSRRRSGIMIAAQPESRFYDTDPTQPGFPFLPNPSRYAAARSVAGDFGLDIAFLGRIGEGVLALEYSDEADAGGPNRIGWGDSSPLPYLYREDRSTRFLVDLRSDRVRATSAEVKITAEVDITEGFSFDCRIGAIFEDGPLFWAPANQRDLLISASGVSLPPDQFTTFTLCLAAATPDTVVRDADADGFARRPTYRVSERCAGGFASCLNAASPPAAQNKAPKRVIDPIGLTTVRRFRDEILAATPKGRDYLAQYREFGPDAYLAVVTTPYALRDIARARDAWLPAITAWVNGDRSTVITQPMLDTLDVLAQHLITLGSARLAATVQDQYQRLDPPSLLNQTIGALQARFEQGVPTRDILRSGFEAGEPGS